MTDNIKQYEEYAHKALTLRSRGSQPPTLKDYRNEPLEYLAGSTDEKEITKIRTGILEVNPGARKILYLCNGEFIAGIEGFQRSDGPLWTDSVRSCAYSLAVNGTDSAILHFYKGLAPFLETLEPRYHQLEIENKPPLSEILDFVSYESLFENIIYQAPLNNRNSEKFRPTIQEASRFHWEHKWDKYLDGNITDATHWISIETADEELGIKPGFLSDYYAFIIDDSPSSPYSPKPWDFEKLISTYYFLRLVENVKGAKGKTSKIPVIINSAGNGPTQDYRYLHKHIYDYNTNIKDSIVFPFLRETDDKYSNMDYGRQLMILLNNLINKDQNKKDHFSTENPSKQSEITEEKKHFYGERRK